MATIKRATKSVSTPPLIAFSFAPVRSVSLCNIRARRCLIDHALLQGGRREGGDLFDDRSAFVQSSALLSLRFRHVTRLPWLLFVYLFLLEELRLTFVRTSLCHDGWTRKSWFASEREFRKKEKSFRDPLSVYPTLRAFFRAPLRFVWLTAYTHVFLCASAGLLAFFESCGENSLLLFATITEYESFFFFLSVLPCTVLCEVVVSPLCNRENDCESRITVEFKLWIRKRGKKK